MTELNEVFKKSEHEEVMEELRKLKDKLDKTIDKINYPTPYIPYVPPCCPCPCVPCRRDCWGCPFSTKPDYWEYVWDSDDYNTAAVSMYPQGVISIQNEVTV